MKALYESVQNLPAASFMVRQFEEKYFSAPYHFHPEIELTYIIKGEGKRYVGSRIDEYQSGDLVLLGGNLPHCWKTALPYTDEINAVSIVIHFKENFLGTPFFDLPEMKWINSLLKLSKNGLHFKGAVALEVGVMMHALLAERNSVKRIGKLLELLDELAHTDAFKVLEQQNIYESISLVEREKINTVTAYIVEHFKKPITIEEIAALVHMSPYAFCKYFKRITRKTLMEMVIDYRIDFAAQQLIRTDQAISQIAFESGFADLSNFYRTFKKKKEMSPLVYRKAFLK